MSATPAILDLIARLEKERDRYREEHRAALAHLRAVERDLVSRERQLIDLRELIADATYKRDWDAAPVIALSPEAVASALDAGREAIDKAAAQVIGEPGHLLEIAEPKPEPKKQQPTHVLTAECRHPATVWCPKCVKDPRAKALLAEINGDPVPPGPRRVEMVGGIKDARRRQAIRELGLWSRMEPVMASLGWAEAGAIARNTPGGPEPTKVSAMLAWAYRAGKAERKEVDPKETASGRGRYKYRLKQKETATA